MSYPDVLSVPPGMGERTVKASMQGRNSQGFDFKGGYHVDDLAKGLGKVMDDLPTTALKPSTVTNAGRNLVESGSKSAGRVGGSSFDELATVSLVNKSRNAADHGATFAGKSSFVSRNADEGMDYGRQAVAKSPANNKVIDLSEYKAKKAEASKPAEAVDEDLNFGKSANHDVQSMDMAEKLGSKSSNVISMDVQAKAPIKGMEDSFQMKKVSGGEGIDYDAIGLPKQKQYELSVINSSVKNGTEVTANVGRVESSVDGIPSASGASRGPSSAGKFASEAEIITIKKYGEWKNDGSGFQKHHLNQDAAYGKVIPKDEGMTIELEGNIISGPVGTQHFNAHQTMELFWDQFRPATKSFPAGPRYGEVPTNLEYTRALKSSLQSAGLSEAQIKQSLREAIRQRLDYGLLGGMEVPLKFDRFGNPKIPNRINSVYRGLK